MDKYFRSNVESLKRDIQKFRDDLGMMLSELGRSTDEQQIEEKRNRLRKAMQEFQGIASRKFRNTNEMIQGQSDRALKCSRGMITKRPITTMAVSFGAGILTALFLERKKND